MIQKAFTVTPLLEEKESVPFLSMFLTYKDFICKTEIKFERNVLEEFEIISKNLKDGKKLNPSLHMYSTRTRKVVEDEEFWSKLGNIISNAQKLETFK